MIDDVRKLRSVLSDRSGAVAITFALLAVMLLGSVALAIDIGRSVTVSSRLERSLDTAALAGAKMLDQDNASDASIKAAVTEYFVAQGPILGMAPDALASLDITIDRANNSVTAKASGALKTTFASVIGLNTVPIGKTSTVVYKMRDVELAMVLDTTGSMGDTPVGDSVAKISSLKTVANAAVDTLYSQAINDRGIRIAIAPFSSSVNAGSYASGTIASNGGSYSNYYNSLSYSQPGSGCAVERLGNDNANDAPPYGADKLRDLTTVGDMNNACPQASIIPLTGRSQQASIKSTISGFNPGGSTAGHIGAAWGMYMLSPGWTSIFSGANAPGAYNDPNVSKNLVLMTDGLFNTSYLSGLAAGSAAATTESYAQFDQICANLKANGVNVYTIGFGLDDPIAASELSKCASSTANFFPVATGTELQAAFSAIVAKLNQLRVAK